MRSLVIAIPTYNDWDALALLLDALDSKLHGLGWNVHVLIVDDGSDQELPRERLARPRRALTRVDVLTLRRNLGHQRAIATALAWIDANMVCDAVVVMDGDGEDSPDDVPRLVACHDQTGGRKVIFAARHRRSEGFVFQSFYHVYRAIHWMLTGIGVRIGNFSLIPQPQLHRLVVVSDLWNHYAAAVIKARIPIARVPTARARRLSGRPTMNFTSLVVHGLSAISVFGDRVGVRLLVTASVLGGAVVSSLLLFVVSNLLSKTAWSWRLTLAAAGTTYLVLNLLVALFLFAFGILGSRDSAAFLPARDHTWFVEGLETLWTGHG